MKHRHGPGSLVIMGVAGCGKSTLAAACARQLNMTLVEGDAFHPSSNLRKMHQGAPLSDADRTDWLTALAAQLAVSRGGVVLACSALRRVYREQLRRASPSLAFVYLELSEHEAHARVAARQGHGFPASLVASQFAALESPSGESGVLTVDATLSVDVLSAKVCAWRRGVQSA